MLSGTLVPISVPLPPEKNPRFTSGRPKLASEEELLSRVSHDA
jgi:hypothetical protein